MSLLWHFINSSSFELELMNIGKTAIKRLDVILNSAIPQGKVVLGFSFTVNYS